MLLYWNWGLGTRANDDVLPTTITMKNELSLTSSNIHEIVAGKLLRLEVGKILDFTIFDRDGELNSEVDTLQPMDQIQSTVWYYK